MNDDTEPRGIYPQSPDGTLDPRALVYDQRGPVYTPRRPPRSDPVDWPLWVGVGAIVTAAALVLLVVITAAVR